jgi:t-SNARE complex subunit (syntaxin)
MIQTEDKNFSRDISTKALVNTNRAALVEHRFRQEQVKKLEELRKDLDTLTQDFLLMKQCIEEIRAHNV